MNNNNLKTMSVEGCDRELAFVIYKGKVYDAPNHQYCISKALLDEYGESPFIDLEDVPSVYDAACEESHRMFKEEDIHGFDLWETDYGNVLSSHFEDGIHACRDWIQEAMKEFNIVKVGYFYDWDGPDRNTIKLVDLE